MGLLDDDGWQSGVAGEGAVVNRRHRLFTQENAAAEIRIEQAAAEEEHPRIGVKVQTQSAIKTEGAVPHRSENAVETVTLVVFEDAPLHLRLPSNHAI